jgi:hypothetical protein
MTSHPLRNPMVNFAKLLHSAFGVESPRAFVILFAISGAIAFGCIGYLVSRAYKEDLRRQEESKAAPMAAAVAPSSQTTKPKPQKRKPKASTAVIPSPTPPPATTPTGQANRPAAVRIGGKSQVGSVSNVTATGGYDGVVTEDSSSVEKISNVFVGPDGVDCLAAWKARVIEHAGNPVEIKKDFAWYQEQVNIGMASWTKEQKEASLASMKKVEDLLMRVASDKAATIDLVKNHIRAVRQK